MAGELNNFETFKTLKDFESNLKSAQKIKKDLDADVETLDALLDEPGKTTFTFKGEKYSLSAIRNLLATYEERQQTAEDNLGEATGALKKAKEDNKDALGFLEQDLDAAKKDRDLAIFQFRQGAIDEATRNAAFTKVQNIEDDKKKIKESGELAFAAAGTPGTRASYAFRVSQPKPEVAATAPAAGVPTAILGQQGRVATVAPMEDRAEQTRFARMKPTEKPAAVGAAGTGGARTGAGTGGAGTAAGGAGAGVSVAAAPVVDVAKRKAFVSAQLAARGLENTPANREMLRKEYKTAVAEGKTTETAAVSTAWETTFREKFPAQSWLLDLDRTKYPDLFKLLNKAVIEEYTPELFAAQVDATDFYKELSQSKQLKTIQSLVGTLGFEGTDFIKFVSDSINFGYQGEILKQKVYEQVFKKDDAGNYINPTALERTKKSADYISTQNIAKAFFNTNPADSDIENVLTGKILSADYERQQREFAKTRYGHLSNLLDQGMTLESIASAYKTTASRLLELNPNAIDMSTGAFEQAVTFGEEGKKRLMTNSEWEKLLRTDPQYGWEKTNNAKDEARALSANIAQAFGRIL
jgi:hypothetical protein